MKQSSVLCGLALLFSSTLTGAGQECDLAIRDGNAAQDLSKILHCLDQRIKSSEVEIADLKKRLGGGGSVTNPAEFDAGPFTASVRGASLQGDKINIGIVIRNKTTEELPISINNNAATVLIDDESGDSLSWSDVGGISRAWEGDKDVRYRTLVPPNSVLNFSLKYNAGKSNGRVYSLTIHLICFADAKSKRFTVPLAVKLKDG